MKITRILAYRVELPLHEGSYKWSGGKSVSVFDSTIVRVETDAGLVGHGEVCPLGPFYLPAYAAGHSMGQYSAMVAAGVLAVSHMAAGKARRTEDVPQRAADAKRSLYIITALIVLLVPWRVVFGG